METHLADGACWIAYPGDHAIEQGNRLMARRNNHGRTEPSPWAAHAAWPTVVFEAEADLPEDETAEVFAQGVYFMRAPGRPGDEDGTWVFPQGKYTFSVRVFNPGGVPALFIRGRHLKTDAAWKVNAWNEEHLPAEAFAACDTPERRPCDFRLGRERREPKSVSDLGGGHTLVDFGEETYGYLKLSGLTGRGRMVALFGEWEDEARDPDLANAENYERFDVDASKAREAELKPRGFRYAHLYALKGDPAVGGVSLDYEYLPLETKGAFRCSDERLNRDEVMKIQTPYMRFYEMEALLKLGRHADVLKDMRSYWGGMLDLGATSFWELYNPEEKGAAHMAMYGRPYGRSACHAWGASPVYLLGRHYLGVEPTTPGFATYAVKPALGGLGWMEGKVPTPTGPVSVSVRGDAVTVVGCGGEGTLYWNGRQCRIPPMGTVTLDSKGGAR